VTGLHATTAIRQRRLHRTRAADYLVALDSPCTHAELQSVDWAALQCVPHWCFLDDRTLRYLQLVSGAVFAGPAIIRWIDGTRIQSVLQLLGQRAYQRVLQDVDERSCAAVFDDYSGDEADPEAMLLASGAAVLLGAVTHPAIQTLLRSVFTEAADPLASEIAQQLYPQALAIFDAEVTALATADQNA